MGRKSNRLGWMTWRPGHVPHTPGPTRRARSSRRTHPDTPPTWARPDSRFASRHYTFTFHAQIPAIHANFHVLGIPKCRVFRPQTTQNRRSEAKIARILLSMGRPSQIGGQTDDFEENQINRPFPAQILGSARSKIASDFRFFSRPLAIHA